MLALGVVSSPVHGHWQVLEESRFGTKDKRPPAIMCAAEYRSGFLHRSLSFKALGFPGQGNGLCKQTPRIDTLRSNVSQNNHPGSFSSGCQLLSFQKIGHLLGGKSCILLLRVRGELGQADKAIVPPANLRETKLNKTHLKEVKSYCTFCDLFSLLNIHSTNP